MSETFPSSAKKRAENKEALLLLLVAAAAFERYKTHMASPHVNSTHTHTQSKHGGGAVADQFLID